MRTAAGVEIELTEQADNSKSDGQDLFPRTVRIRSLRAMIHGFIPILQIRSLGIVSLTA